MGSCSRILETIDGSLDIPSLFCEFLKIAEVSKDVEFDILKYL